MPKDWMVQNRIKWPTKSLSKPSVQDYDLWVMKLASLNTQVQQSRDEESSVISSMGLEIH